MKLVIQIPCYNEEATLPATLRELPKKLPGIDRIETLVIDDGSTDRTVEVARAHGVGHVVELKKRSGLSNAFRKGLESALVLGADIVVNTDGDNQYRGEDIEKLVRPIVERRAEIVIGCRDVKGNHDFSWLKKRLQGFGSRVVRGLSQTDIPDATTGFRAFSREAALRLNVVNHYTYTVETIIQAGRQRIPMAHVSIRTNPKTRESRLIKSLPAYIARSTAIMFRAYLLHEPLKVFTRLGLLVSLVGVGLVARFLYYFFTQDRPGHLQSLVIAAVFLLAGFGTILLGLLGDLLAQNRRLLEEILYRTKKQELNGR